MAHSPSITEAVGRQTVSNKVAFIGGTVISSHLAAPIEDAVVLVKNGKIEAVGPATMDVAGDYQIVDVTGQYLAPGYIDAHMHFFQSGSAFTRPDSFDYSKIQPYESDRTWVREHMADTYLRYLVSGVTGVVDMCGPSLNYQVRAEARREAFTPTVAIAGACISSFSAPILDLGDGDPVFQYTNSTDDAVAFVKAQLQKGPDLIKIIWSPDQGETPQQLFDLFKDAIQLARREGIPVAVHATELANAKMAIRAGADILVHGVMTEAIDDEFVALIKQHQTIYMPTLVVHEKTVEIAGNDLKFSNHEHGLAHPDILESFKLADVMPEKAGAMVQIMHKYMPYVDAEEAEVAALSEQEQFIVGQLRGFFSSKLTQIQRDNLLRLYREGITLALGTDAGNPGVLHGGSLYTEMTEWHKAGLPLSAILKASTLNGAKVMGHEASLGSIEVGKWADLIVLEKDPLKDLDNLSSVAAVIKGGRYRTVNQLKAQLETKR
ncbi:amidohydrolase family protein [Kordiimonas sp. SCSIO 12603]|uniref:amidohydrolase family protein n=1 Tax=Kordiimonas sp. SCSIO 12603 TaxID=2829596 RepID=UPI00210617E4|nr:amidohydrolase family protein [Kordiimonas sp. SCSIO 12603]UTW59541.1 amidohydrolase family protein [Kordiimonas sp. SCSIO 12603]